MLNWGQIYFPLGRSPSKGKIDLSPIKHAPIYSAPINYRRALMASAISMLRTSRVRLLAATSAL